MADRLLTVADLAARWSCEESTVLAHVRDDGLQFVAVGNKPRDRSAPGPKMYRFRPADVENWEAARVMAWPRQGEPPRADPPIAPKLPAVPGWDGVVRCPPSKGKRMQT